jgi:hypothetical protein
MKNIIKPFLIMIIFTFLGIYFVNAQELPAAQKDLQRFVGNWVCKNISMTIGDKTYGGEYSFNCKSAIDGKGIYAEESYENVDLGKMHGLDMAGYDPNLKNIQWYTIDNQGTCHDHIGYWTDKDHFYMQYQGIANGTAFVEKLYFNFLSDNKMEFKMIGENNGVVSEKSSGEFVKK